MLAALHPPWVRDGAACKSKIANLKTGYHFIKAFNGVTGGINWFDPEMPAGYKEERFTAMADGGAKIKSKISFGRQPQQQYSTRADQGSP